MAITRLEQETIIIFNEEEPAASVFTCNGSLRRKLEKLREERPGEVTHGDGGKFIIPKKWVKVTAARRLSPEARATLSERAKLQFSAEKAHDLP